MSQPPRPQPTPRAVARKMYGHLFGVTHGDALQAAAETFAQVDPGGQRFMLAHLTYLLLEQMGQVTHQLKELGGTADAVHDELVDFKSGMIGRGQQEEVEEADEGAANEGPAEPTPRRSLLPLTPTNDSDEDDDGEGEGDIPSEGGQA